MKTRHIGYSITSALLATACGSSEVPVGLGTGSAALGGLGEPPDHGACDTRLTNCAEVCVALDADPANCGGCGVTCASGDTCANGSCVDPSSTPDASQGGCAQNDSPCGGACVSFATDPLNCGGCGIACQAGESCIRAACSGGNPPADAGHNPDTSIPESDGGVTFKLIVTYNGYDSSFGQDEHVWLQDVTTSANGTPVGSLSCGGGSFSANETDTYTGLVPGHTYAYDYWLDTSTSTFCFGYPVPPYYAHTFGPVTGDTTIEVSPSDPLTSR